MDLKIKKIMAALFDVSADDIDEKSSTETLSAWNSIQHMSLVRALENEFDVTIDEDELVMMVNYKKITRVLSRKLS